MDGRSEKVAGDGGSAEAVRIAFDPDFDSGAWPGPLGDGETTAAFARPWVGSDGLRGILETALGLGGLVPSSAERVAGLAKSVLNIDGFWSASAANDAFGTARVLLRWIDWLVLHGWDGRAPNPPQNTPRLTDLAALYSSAGNGGPGRLAAIARTLDKRKAGLASIETFEPVDRLPPLWKSIFDKLAAQGVEIREIESMDPASLAGSDLHAAIQAALGKNGPAHRQEFKPTGDSSLVLFRPYNPLDAAESVAAWLSSLEDTEGVLIVSPSPALDEALRRFGLPSAGARDTAPDKPCLVILPLVLAMGWDPPNPQRALDLLLIPDGPVPPSIAGRLRNALREWPAVRSPDWAKALAAGLDAVSDPELRRRHSERLKGIFRKDTETGRLYPREALERRAALVKAWVSARRHARPEPPDTLSADLDAVIVQCGLFVRILDAAGISALTETQIRKLCSGASEGASSPRRHPRQTGIVAVDQPGAVAGAARRVIWWNFDSDSTPTPFALPLSRAERTALYKMDVHLTPAVKQAADLARRRRRPLFHAAESVLLVCPVFGEDGEERHHHPLWDEIAARVPDGTGLTAIVKRRLTPLGPVPTRRDEHLPLPKAKRAWTAPASLVSLPGRLSPSGMHDLIGCPFKWVLGYLGRLRDPESADLVESERLTGKLSHEILALVLQRKPRNGNAARTLALELFDTLGRQLAAPLFLPGAPFQKSVARKATGDAAADLVGLLRKAGLAVIAVESWAEGRTARLDLHGRIDLLAGPPTVIIDLKWGGEAYRRDQFRKGTALQLAAYARMLGGEGPLPPVAYYIIMNQRLVMPRGAPFPGFAGIEGPPLAETWRAVEETAVERLAAVGVGRIEAAAVPAGEPTGLILDDNESDEAESDRPDDGVAKEDALKNGRLVLKAPCGFCSFGFLCGREWEDGR